MKTATKRILTIAALLCTQSPLFGFKFTFMNQTGKGLNLAVNVAGQKENAEIAQGASHTFDYDKFGGWDNILDMSGLCLNKATAKLLGEEGGVPKMVQLLNQNKMPYYSFCSDTTFELTVKNGNFIATAKK